MIRHSVSSNGKKGSMNFQTGNLDKFSSFDTGFVDFAQSQTNFQRKWKSFERNWTLYNTKNLHSIFFFLSILKRTNLPLLNHLYWFIKFLRATLKPFSLIYKILTIEGSLSCDGSNLEMGVLELFDFSKVIRKREMFWLF